MPGWDDRTLNQLGECGDPPADEAVSTLVGVGDVHRVADLLNALVVNDGIAAVELPPELLEFTTFSAELPAWADRERIKRAQWFFQLWGLQMTTCVGCAALPRLFASPRIAKATAISTADQHYEARWMAQMFQFAVDVLSPFGLDGPDSEGILAAQSLRLRHAAMRHMIRGGAATRPGLWDRRWGTPMSQEDTALLIATMARMTAALAKLGVVVKGEDSEDLVHLWSVVGALLGVRHELLAGSAAEAGELAAALRARLRAPSDESLALVDALIGFLQAAAPRFGDVDVFPTLMRHLIGEELAGQLQIPEGVPAVWKLSPRLKRLSTHVETHVARRRVIERLAEPVGRDLLGGLMAESGLVIGGPIAVSPQLSKSWDLPMPTDPTAAG
jgi:hypothetical protein